MAEKIKDDDFQSRVLDSKLPSLILFYADWSGPCRMMDFSIDEVAEDFSGKASCFKMDIDEGPNTSAEYGVRSLPTVKIFRSGRELKTLVGMVRGVDIRLALDDVI
ncbi:unnamed protein product [Closterium sp. Yama58-4]|nr:unnamed protein product [Closterium sp. Yama58-4]